MINSMGLANAAYTAEYNVDDAGLSKRNQAIFFLVRLSISELRCSSREGSERVGLAPCRSPPLYEIPITRHLRPSCFFMTSSSTLRARLADAGWPWR